MPSPSIQTYTPVNYSHKFYFSSTNESLPKWVEKRQGTEFLSRYFEMFEGGLHSLG